MIDPIHKARRQKTSRADHGSNASRRHDIRPARRRLFLVGAAFCVIASGLALRLLGYGIGLPFLVVKYGGSLLWGSMVYLLVAAFLARRSPGIVAGLSLGLAIAVELSRLYHTPWLDAFRLTTAGALLLGRIFSTWNILAYAVGIAAAAGLDRRCFPPAPPSGRSRSRRGPC